MSHDANMLIFCLSCAFLEIRDVTSLLQCSKAMWLSRHSVQSAFLADGLKATTGRLLQVKRLFPYISELSIHIGGEWNLDWGTFEHLDTLFVIGSEQARRTDNESQLSVSNCRLRSLTLERVGGSQCIGLYSFVAQFGTLRSLRIHRSSPLLLAGISQSIEALPCLEEVQLSECFTDAGALSLRNLRKLKRLRITNCPNISAISTINHLDSLAELLLENVRIATSTLEVVLQHCPMLRSLNTSKCSNLRGPVVIAHRQLRALQLHFCSNVRSVHITCPSLSDLRVRACYSMQSCTVMSDRLVALDLSQHSALTGLHLQCGRLATLDLTGCSGLALNMTGYETRSSGQLLAVDLEALLDKISLATESEEDAASDSDRSSSRSARLVSSHRVLDSAHAPASCSSEDLNQRACEHVLTALHAKCPALDLQSLISTGIRGTLLDDHCDFLLKFAEMLTPQRYNPAVVMENVSCATRGPIVVRKNVRHDKGTVRKPRRAKK